MTKDHGIHENGFVIVMDEYPERKFMKHKTLSTLRDVLKDAIECHLPPDSHNEEDQINLFGTLLEKVNTKILDLPMTQCCSQSVFFKISQVYPLITVWRNTIALEMALIAEIEMMFKNYEWEKTDGKAE